MGKQIIDDDMDGDFDTDIDDIAATIHSADLFEPSHGKRRKHGARRRPDKGHHERTSKEKLEDWGEDYYDD